MSIWRALSPREHGLWAWVLVPMLSATIQAPRAWLGCAACISGFATFNALTRAQQEPGARAAAVMAGLTTLGLGLGALLTAPLPLPLLIGFGVAGAGAASVALQGRLPRRPEVELSAIFALCALAATVAVAAGADPQQAALTLFIVATWLVTGLVYVNGLLARILPNRAPWARGRSVALTLIALCLALGIGSGAPGSGAIPLLYVLRTLHRPPNRPSDAKRVGLTELAWAVGVGVLAAL